MKDINVIYGINRYLLTHENPVNIVFNGYSIETNYLLVWDPPQLSAWDQFWRSDRGKALSIGITVIAAVYCILAANISSFLWTVGGTIAFLGVGGAISGFISLNQGNGFWESFSAYVNENLVESVAISMIFLLAVIGMSALKTALITSKKSALSNAQNISKCFIKGTLVKTEEGDKAIEEIKVGDKVWAYDEETGKKKLKEVVQLFRNTTKQWTLVEIDGENGKETITCTPGHKFFLPENKKRRNTNEVHEHDGYELLSEQWVSAQHLKIGDKVLLENGKYGIIVKIVIKELEEPEVTYNFEVQDFHTYYVGETSVLVHNAGGPCGGELADDGIGFDTFDELKAHMGPAGKGKEWHHIVEQNQMKHSGFSAKQIHNTNNIRAVDVGIHRKISSFYSSRSGQFSRFRIGLRGTSFEHQFNEGIRILQMFGG